MVKYPPLLSALWRPEPLFFLPFYYHNLHHVTWAPTYLLSRFPNTYRPLSQSCVLRAKPLPPRPPLLPESEIESKALHGSGPGGQKINKTSSAIQLKHLPTGIVVKSQATRSRSQNMKIAQRLLSDEVDVLRNGKESRRDRVREILAKKKGRGERKRIKKYRERESKESASVEDQGVEEEEEEEEEEVIEDDELAVENTVEELPQQQQANTATQQPPSRDLLNKFYAEVEARKKENQNG